MKIEYNEVKDMLQEIRSLEFKVQAIPITTIKETYTFWYNINLNGVSSSMADTGGDYDTNLMQYFDTCYRYGRYARAEEVKEKPE